MTHARNETTGGETTLHTAGLGSLPDIEHITTNTTTSPVVWNPDRQQRDDPTPTTENFSRRTAFCLPGYR